MPLRIVETKVRKCGKRKEYGLYLVGGGNTSPDGVLALFSRMNPPVPYQVKLHRGPRLVNANSVLGRQPLETWWTGSSRDTEEKKSADEWALDTFGMTLSKRLETGECSGSKTADEAMAVLVSRVQLDANDHRLSDYFRQMTRDDIQELPRVSQHYNRLHEHLALFIINKTVGELMGAQAAVWRMAYTLPPGKRSLFVPNLVRLLVLLNLPKDAMALKNLFGGS